MQQIRIILLAVVVAFLSPACIKQIDVKTRSEKPILVVEGAITTIAEPYTVRLTYSGNFTRGNVIPDESLEKDATVSISDNEGNTTPLIYKDNGVYQTTDPAYIGQSGRSYHVIVELKNGKKFISVPEKIHPPVPIANTSTSFNFYTPSGINVYADLNDPADQENYYQWAFYSWAPRKTNGIGCGFGCILYQYCFQKITEPDFDIMSDAAFNGNTLKNRLLGVSPIYWFGKHYIDIRLQSITREAYQFMQRFNDQQTRTGSILDPLPASVRGNVYNAANPDELALGYFSASSVTHKRAILVPFSITQFLLDQTAATFIPYGPKICFEAFENALPYPPPPANQNPPPPGWENAEVIEVRW